MFGYVIGNWGELTQAQQDRYKAVYCGICRAIHHQASQTARLSLTYDMAFLALLLMSLYEPEEERGGNACILHPVRHRPWVENPAVSYAADMNVALAYFKCLDDWQDEKKLPARAMASMLHKSCPEIRDRWPRQWKAIGDCLTELSQLEEAGCPNPDLPANAFGALMAELFVWKEDFWSPTLRDMGRSLGRFVYLLDAVLDYDKDEKKKNYNPFLAMGQGKQPEKWEEYLVLTMGRCASAYERLPLVQDKALLDNILYSGVWVAYRGKEQKEDHR